MAVPIHIAYTDLQDTFNCDQHGFCRSRVLQDGMFAAICTIGHYLLRRNEASSHFSSIKTC